jgi:flagellar M-ring protein FliF
MANAVAAPAPFPSAPLLTQIRAMPARSRIVAMVGGAFSIALLVAGWLWSQAPDYKVLFTGIADKDGGAVVAALNQMNVPYRIGEGGGVILVPSNVVHETRLKLASQGLPKAGNPGFDLMENPRFGITQFQEQVHYQRAIEGELSRSIQSLSVVRSARVHLALPKQSVFMKEQQKTSASVLLTLYPGKSLDRTQIAGITHLVASSLPDLQTRNVSIIDDAGNLLSQPPDANAAGQLDANQLSYVHRVEEGYIKRILDILTPLHGEGNVRAQVKAEVDFSESESTSEAFKPNQNAAEATVRSMQISETPNAGSGASGVPGALSNQPPATPTAQVQGNAPTNPTGAAAAAAAAATKRDAITNYEVDKTTRHVRTRVGAVKRVTAAVVINHRKSVSAGKAQSTPLTAEEVAQINSLVREAIGFQKDRGDSINVVNAPFTVVAPEVVPEIPLWKQPEVLATAKDVGRFLLPAALVIYLWLGIIRPGMQKLSASAAAAEAGDEAASAAAGTGAAPALPSPLDNVRQLAKQDPSAVANVVKNWASGNE